MRKNHILVLSLVASGIAIELILMANVMTGLAYSQQALSTNSIASAVGENYALDSGDLGEVLMVYPEGAPITDEDHEFGREPDFSNEPTPVFGDELNEDPLEEGIPFDGGAPILGDPGGYNAYPGPSSSSGSSGWSYPAPPTLPAGPTEVLPTDVPAATEAPGATASPEITQPPVATQQPVATQPPAAPTATLPAAPTPTSGPSTGPQQPTATPPSPAPPTAAATASLTAAVPTLDSAPSALTLLSVRANSAPGLDGVGDDPAWGSAPSVILATSGGANNSATQVNVQSVYDGEHVYFLLRWADPTLSFLRNPWEKQADGSWKRLADPENSGRDDNLYYEDKLAIFWPAGDQPEFATLGCGSACHAGENPEAKPYGNMYTPGSGQILDLWHWKAVRGVGQVDDLYLDSTRYSADTPAAGFKPDPADGGGYRNNASEDRSSPAYMPPGGGQKNGAPGFILEAEKVDLDTNLFQAGERLPSILTEAFLGDRGDIAAAWRYADGQWTLEIRRRLVTGSPYDVQFDQPEKSYPFGLATFDNAQVRHAVQQNLAVLRFQK